jgi:hypothetical protein
MNHMTDAFPCADSDWLVFLREISNKSVLAARTRNSDFSFFSISLVTVHKIAGCIHALYCGALQLFAGRGAAQAFN